MEYIVTHKLSGIGGVQHKNPMFNVTDLEFVKPGDEYLHPLLLFNLIEDRGNIIEKVLQIYQLDMLLFGYNVTMINGSYYATCMDGQWPC